MAQIQDLIVRYGDWMERRPTQAMLVHVAVYLAVSAGVIALGLTVAK